MIILLLLYDSALLVSDWGLFEIEQWPWVIDDLGGVDFIDGSGPLVEGLWVMFFGDEHDEFVESIRGGGEDLLEGW